MIDNFDSFENSDHSDISDRFDTTVEIVLTSSVEAISNYLSHRIWTGDLKQKSSILDNRGVIARLKSY